MIRIAAAQINVVVGDLEGNADKIISFIRKSKEQEVDIVIFPELVICGYPPEDLLHKDHFVQDNIKALRFIVKKVKDITAIVGFVDTDKKGNLYNAAAILANGKIQGVYHKQKLPNYGVFDEKRYFKSGEKVGKFLFQDIKYGVSICEDIWAEKDDGNNSRNTDINFLINLSSSPYDVGKLKAREKLLKSKAKANGIFICYVNLIGGQDELVFDGGSLMVDAKGKIIARGKSFQEDLLLCDLPIGEEESEKNGINKNILKRGIKIERIYQALALGTHDYIVKNGFKKVVIGLSGGIDSSIVATIAVDAIGAENVVGVSMPSMYSSPGTQKDAKLLAKNLGIEYKEIPIKSLYDSYNQILEKEFAGLKFDVTEENLQARIRGNLLMALSNKFGWLVLTTGNKSEVAVGYCTLYGDMSGGFAMIKDVPKTVVYDLAKYRNAKAGKNLIPHSVLIRPPTAELRRNQKDQDSLGRYDLLDPILEDYVEGHKSFAYISKGRDKRRVKQIINLVDHSEYKRRQAPPGIKITSRAFGRDWRLPITNKYKEF